MPLTHAGGSPAGGVLALGHGDARWRDDAVAWTVGVSLLLHLAGYGVATLWKAAPPPASEVSIPVQLLTEQQFARETGIGSDAAAGRPPPQTMPASIPRPAAISPDDAMIRPPVMLSAAALADPRNRQARRMLPQTEPTERSIQLCGIEAIEQVRAWNPSFQPERVVSYATADLAITGDAIRAGGAAILGAGAWYAMQFECGLSPDHGSVVSFAFHVGDAIPREQWEAHSLPVVAGGEDTGP